MNSEKIRLQIQYLDIDIRHFNIDIEISKTISIPALEAIYYTIDIKFKIQQKFPII